MKRKFISNHLFSAQVIHFVSFFLFFFSPVILCQPIDKDLTTKIMNALALYNMLDFTIVLTQAEKLRPGIIEFVTTYSTRLS